MYLIVSISSMYCDLRWSSLITLDYFLRSHHRNLFMVYCKIENDNVRLIISDTCTVRSFSIYASISYVACRLHWEKYELRISILIQLSQRKWFCRWSFVLEVTNLLSQLVGCLLVQRLDLPYFLRYLLLHYGSIFLSHPQALHVTQEIHPLPNRLYYYGKPSITIAHLLSISYSRDIKILSKLVLKTIKTFLDFVCDYIFQSRKKSQESFVVYLKFEKFSTWLP